MLHFFRKNIKIVVGVMALFAFLFFNSKAMTIDNVSQSKAVFSVSNPNNLLPANYNHPQKNKKNDLIKTPRSRRKYGLNETNAALIPSLNAITFYYTSSSIDVDIKNHLFQSSVSFSLLRGPPVV